jgi:hypothetical protein
MQYWAGFVGDRLDTREVDTGFGGWGDHRVRSPAIFTSKEAARKEYQDVRKIEVRVVSRKKAK